MAQLVFVYNANAGFMNRMFDSLHKLMRPSTYQCSLCMITFNYSGMRDSWKVYLNNLPIEKKFIHRDEFIVQYPDKKNLCLPSVFLQEDNELTQIVTAKDLNQTDLKGLMERISNALK